MVGELIPIAEVLGLALGTYAIEKVAEAGSSKIIGRLKKYMGKDLTADEKELMIEDIMLTLSELSGVSIGGNTIKVIRSAENQKLICTCVFVRSIRLERQLALLDMKGIKAKEDKEQVRNEIKGLISNIRAKIWSNKEMKKMMRDTSVQRHIKNDLKEVRKSLKEIIKKIDVIDEKIDHAVEILENRSTAVETNPVETTFLEPTSNFMGRNEETLKLSSLIEEHNTIFVCGMGGIGKSELCRDFAKKWMKEENESGRRSVAWLVYEGDLKRTIAWKLKVEGVIEREIGDEEELFRKKMSDLNKNPQTLLIIDNFNVTSDKCLNHVSSYNFKKIFISRKRKYCSEPHHSLELDALSEEDSFKLFSKSLRTGEDWIKSRGSDIRKLLRHIDYHTLTIGLMAGHINNYETEPKDLLEIMSSGMSGLERKIKQTKDGEDDTAIVHEHLLKLFGLLSLKDDEENVLRIASMLPASGMPRERFREFSGMDHSNSDDVFASLEDQRWVDVSFDKTLGKNFISVHPLIADLLREKLEPDENKCKVFFDSLETFFGGDDIYSNWPEKMRTLPVLISAANMAGGYPYAFSTHSLAGRYLSELGDYDEALEYYFKALEVVKKVLGANHPATAGSYGNVGVAYWSKGDYDEALEYHFKALEIMKKEFGEDHPDTAKSYDNIGVAYNMKGDYDEALDYHFKALEIMKKEFGANHQDIARSYDNIGIAYNMRGDCDEALEYHFKALRINEKEFGANHPSTARSYGNIGVAYNMKGDYDEALEYYLKTLEIMKKVLGEDHPDTAKSYDNIGVAYCGKGDYDEALEYHFKALEIMERVLGVSHPDTVGSYNNIGATYLKIGDHDKASEYIKKGAPPQ
ncbi:MAG: tetratricopeptide repeat protein [Methanomassiliicoccaceae archaeon]|nr:tetratricopeptide repeat protein [Methanomassiliicoccaceae archaeon]